MKFIPLLSKDDFACHSVPTQIDCVGDYSINHALIAVAQEVAELLQAYTVQAEGSNSSQMTAMLKNKEF